MNLKEYQTLIEQREELRKKVHKATGVLESSKERLRKEHGCKTVKQAKRKLLAKRKEKERLKEEYQETIETFKKENKNALALLEGKGK